MFDPSKAQVPLHSTCACAKLHLVSDSGLGRVGWDKTHELIPRSGGSVRAVSICTVNFAYAGVAPHTGATVGDCSAFESRSGGEAFVAMVKAADLRNRDHLAVVWRLDGASTRAVFVERQMRPRAVIVIGVRGQDPAQMTLVKDHYA